MIICPNCLYQNVNSAVVCKVCQTELPTTSSCPNCGASIQLGAHFCGQCGCNLNDEQRELDEIIALTADDPAPDFASSDTPFAFPDSQPPEPLVIPDLAPDSAVPSATDSPPSTNDLPDRGSPIPTFSIYPENTQFRESKTQLQQQTVQLVHVQTNAAIDLPLNLDLIHIGKPNERIPPGIDVSVFPNAEIVSRVHANIRLEGGHYFIEDVGSSNGTYINNIPLLPGNRHRLRSGDRIALGKGNLVTFLFQLN